MSFCAGLAEADVNMGVESPFQSSCRFGERGASNGSPSTGLETEQAGKGRLGSSQPCPLPKGHRLNQTQVGESSFHDIFFFFLSALAAPFVTFSFSFLI